MDKKISFSLSVMLYFCKVEMYHFDKTTNL